VTLIALPTPVDFSAESTSKQVLVGMTLLPPKRSLAPGYSGEARSVALADRASFPCDLELSHPAQPERDCNGHPSQCAEEEADLVPLTASCSSSRCSASAI
jgi:hypothetical protein